MITDDIYVDICESDKIKFGECGVHYNNNEPILVFRTTGFCTHYFNYSTIEYYEYANFLNYEYTNYINLLFIDKLQDFKNFIDYFVLKSLRLQNVENEKLVNVLSDKLLQLSKITSVFEFVKLLRNLKYNSIDKILEYFEIDNDYALLLLFFTTSVDSNFLYHEYELYPDLITIQFIKEKNIDFKTFLVLKFLKLLFLDVKITAKKLLEYKNAMFTYLDEISEYELVLFFNRKGPGTCEHYLRNLRLFHVLKLDISKLSKVPIIIKGSFRNGELHDYNNTHVHSYISTTIVISTELEILNNLKTPLEEEFLNCKLKNIDQPSSCIFIIIEFSEAEFSINTLKGFDCTFILEEKFYPTFVSAWNNAHPLYKIKKENENFPFYPSYYLYINFLIKYPHLNVLINYFNLRYFCGLQSVQGAECFYNLEAKKPYEILRCSKYAAKMITNIYTSPNIYAFNSYDNLLRKKIPKELLTSRKIFNTLDKLQFLNVFTVLDNVFTIMIDTFPDRGLNWCINFLKYLHLNHKQEVFELLEYYTECFGICEQLSIEKKYIKVQKKVSRYNPRLEIVEKVYAIKAYHDELSNLSNKIKYEHTDDLINEVYKSNYKYLENIEYDKYTLVMPQKSEDIIREGIVLEHCVASYCERVANNKSIIVFLRKVDDINTPLYTIELINSSMYKVIQKKGLANCLLHNEAEKALSDIIKRANENRLDKNWVV